jgi:tetratricopeptide (TPR) repeat protein
VSLRGYALLLTEAGNHSAAARYLSRVDEDAPHYATAKVEYGWIQELLGTRDEVLQLDYQTVLSAGLKTRESTLALAALGHFHHVRGDGARARVFYHRCLHQNPDNAYCLILSGCLEATEVGKRNALLPSTRTIVQPQGPIVERSGGGAMKHELDVADEDEAIDAQFRRGLFFLQNPNSNRWVGLLAYAEFVANRLQDCKRAEDIFWEAARLSCKYSVWAVIALAHFYQYIWDDLDRARKVR